MKCIKQELCANMAQCNCSYLTELAVQSQQRNKKSCVEDSEKLCLLCVPAAAVWSTFLKSLWKGKILKGLWKKIWMRKISASFSVLILTHHDKVNCIFLSPRAVISHCSWIHPVFHKISCHYTKITWFSGISTDYWFTWSFNLWNRNISCVSVCLYINASCIFLHLYLILHRIRQICLKVPCPKYKSIVLEPFCGRPLNFLWSKWVP